MKRASARLSSSHDRRARLRSPRTYLGVSAALVFALGACGGDDDDDATSDATADATTDATDLEPAPTTTAAAPAPTTTAAAPASTAPPTVEYVTEGASVIVANASNVDGAAGRMSARLADVGYSMGDAANSTEGQLETTKVYYDPENEAAQAVAESLRDALGGVGIEVAEVGSPPPLDTGTLGDASVLVAMGNDTADRSLEDLQGVTPTADTADDTADTGEDTSEATADATADG